MNRDRWDETEGSVQIVVFEGRPVVAEGLAALLSDDERIDIAGVTSRFDELAQMLTTTDVQVVVFGIENQTAEDLGDLMAAIDAVAEGAGRQLGLVGVVPGEREAATRYSSLSLPTVPTTVSPTELREAILNACPGRGPAVPLRVAPHRSAQASVRRPDVVTARLTPREWQVLRALEQGLSTREIAASLEISVNTVRTHVQHLLPKLGVHSRLQAAARAAASPTEAPRTPNRYKQTGGER